MTESLTSTELIRKKATLEYDLLRMMQKEAMFFAACMGRKITIKTQIEYERLPDDDPLIFGAAKAHTTVQQLNLPYVQVECISNLKSQALDKFDLPQSHMPPDCYVSPIQPQYGGRR